MKKKIGIVTIIDYNNYGNRLQNYAVQEVLKSLGFEIETIVNYPQKKLSYSDRIKIAKDKSITQLFINIYSKMRKKIYATKSEKKLNYYSNLRKTAFLEFTNKYINESNFIITLDNVDNNVGDLYDLFVVGSDQVWNPTYRKGSSIDFLTFAPSEKRVAYAPSFGVSALPSQFERDYKKWLMEFKSLSVREDAGADIIKDLTNREAKVLVDPTVMLNKSEWLEIAKPHNLKPSKPFLLTYILGELSKDVKELIKTLSKEYNLDIVNLGSYEQIERYDADPSEFIDYINSSHIFLTDSFHGAVFSIILEKQFIVFDRLGNVPSMNSRIDTLLNKFKLNDRKWESIKTSRDYFGVDFSHTGPIFEEEKAKAYKYLKDALEIEEVI